jgi:hypothetical protein
MAETPPQQIPTCEELKTFVPHSICDELNKFVAQIHCEYEVWYAKSVRVTYRWWWLLQAISLLSGFGFAVIAALVAADVFQDPRYKTLTVIALIVLPALSSLAASTILQFRVYDIWRLRESGRIAFQNLAIEGRRRARAAKTEEECAAIFEDIQEKAHEIESSQSENFFAFTKKGFVSRYRRDEEDKQKNDE